MRFNNLIIMIIISAVSRVANQLLPSLTIADNHCCITSNLNRVSSSYCLPSQQGEGLLAATEPSLQYFSFNRP
jgi:hypothetical protein